LQVKVLAAKAIYPHVSVMLVIVEDAGLSRQAMIFPHYYYPDVHAPLAGGWA
jgi:hypothetical protein